MQILWYNEESTIGDVIKATSRLVDDILVINDGSIDNIVNRGPGKTIKRGYEEALKRGADIVVPGKKFLRPVKSFYY